MYRAAASRKTEPFFPGRHIPSWGLYGDGGKRFPAVSVFVFREECTMSLIDIQHLSYTYDGQYDPVFENVCLQLDTGWRLGFVG